MHDHGSQRHTRAGGGESYSARPHPEPVVLDIGGDIGALIGHTDAGMHGVEIEVSAGGADHDRSHKDVVEREINGRPAYTAVFDGLPEGTYTLWVDGVPRARGVAIDGAAVAQLDWPGGRLPTAG